MILYRLQMFLEDDDGTGWTNEWFPLEKDARRALNAARAAEHQARLDRVEVPTGREALCYLMNNFDANHMNLEGVLLGRSP